MSHDFMIPNPITDAGTAADGNLAIEATFSSDINTQFFDTMPMGCIGLDENHNMTKINDIGSQLLGIGKKFLIGKNICRYLSPISQATFPLYIAEVANEKNTSNRNFQFISKDGPFVDCKVDAKCLVDTNSLKKQIYLFFSPTPHHYANDSDQRNTARHDLIYRQNSVNELAGIIAHELKNPLTVILNYINGCIRKLESDTYKSEDIIKALKSASQQSSRVNELILRLRHFQYKKTLNIEAMSINEMISNVISIIKNDVNEFGVTIQFRSIEDILVKADKLYIEQLLLNLCRNSIDSLRDHNITTPLLIIEVNRVNKSALEVKIIDNGPGFSKENATRLFDPYFTTKPYGIGIGLALSQSIAIAHGSKIEPEINFFNGATFKFELQLSD